MEKNIFVSIDFDETKDPKIEQFKKTTYYFTTKTVDKSYWFSFAPNTNTFYNSVEQLAIMKENKNFRETEYYNKPVYFLGFLQHRKK